MLGNFELTPKVILIYSIIVIGIALIAMVLVIIVNSPKESSLPEKDLLQILSEENTGQKNNASLNGSVESGSSGLISPRDLIVPDAWEELMHHQPVKIRERQDGWTSEDIAEYWYSPIQTHKESLEAAIEKQVDKMLEEIP